MCHHSFLFILLDAYQEEKVPVNSASQNTGQSKKGTRVVLRLNPKISPYKMAVFPLLANKPELVKFAKEIHGDLKKKFVVAWDDIGNIGKRYRRQDEIGTPFCVTIDFESLEDKQVTIRDRDSLAQIRVPIKELDKILATKLGGEAFDASTLWARRDK